MEYGILPTSSRNKVPPLAVSKCPFLSETAPVKAPLTAPKNSEACKSLGMLPQLTATKGLSRLSL